MPSLADLQRRYSLEKDTLDLPLHCEEALMADVRSRLSPAQMVEQKLRDILHKGSDFSVLKVSLPSLRRRAK